MEPALPLLSAQNTNVMTGRPNKDHVSFPVTSVQPERMLHVSPSGATAPLDTETTHKRQKLSNTAAVYTLNSVRDLALVENSYTTVADKLSNTELLVREAMNDKVLVQTRSYGKGVLMQKGNKGWDHNPVISTEPLRRALGRGNSRGRPP